MIFKQMIYWTSETLIISLLQLFFIYFFYKSQRLENDLNVVMKKYIKTIKLVALF